MSQCIQEQFVGCGLAWPLKDLSWLGDVAMRAFVEYLGFDQCMLNVSAITYYNMLVIILIDDGTFVTLHVLSR